MKIQDKKICKMPLMQYLEGDLQREIPRFEKKKPFKSVTAASTLKN